jgi:opacity protein-like surface antigen
MQRAMGALILVLAAPAPALAEEDIPEPGSPPPASFDYLQYGVAFAAETVVSAGDVCPSRESAPCIFGSGGGLEVHVGYRSRGPWYVGGAYESSRQDSSNLMRLAILQQLRAESRYYLDEGNRFTPYVTGGVGAALYGNEWASETGGVVSFLGGGFEFQLSRTTVVGAALAYRPFLFRGWTDSAGQRRADRYLGFGLAHVVALSLVLEVRDPLPRW